MAKSIPKVRKPRVRASAPTLRERQEAARAQEEAQADKPAKKSRFSRLKSPFKKLRLRQRRPVRALAKVFRPVGRLLKWLIPSYFINSWRELRQVVWPSRKETWRLTLAVFVFSLVFGAMVAGVDKGLDEIFKKVVLK